MCAQFHPSEDMVVSASLDQTVRVWDISGKLPPYVHVQKCSGHLCIVLLYSPCYCYSGRKSCTCITVWVCDYLRFCCVTILNLMYLSIDTVILHFCPSSTLNRAVDMLRFCLIDLKSQLIAEFVKNHAICKKLRKLKWNICFNLRFFATNWNDVSSRASEFVQWCNHIMASKCIRSHNLGKNPIICKKKKC